MNSTSEYTRVFICSIPRTRSHLLAKLLGSHPATATTNYPLQVAFSVGAQLADHDRIRKVFDVSDPTAEEYTYQGQIDTLQRFIAKTECEGKVPVIKEHVYCVMKPGLFQPGGSYDTIPMAPMVDRMLDINAGGANDTKEQQRVIPSTIPNPTVLSDRFLFSFSPIILIRHPVHAFPSYIRARKVLGVELSGPDAEGKASYRLQRILFDYWRGRTSRESDSQDSKIQQGWPVVLDGDRLVADTEGLMKKLCERLRIDPALVQYSWAPVHEVPQLSDNAHKAFLTQIRTSTGVLTDPNAILAPDMEEEMKKWVTEWDEDIAKNLEKLVQAAMPDYEYLLQFHI